MAGKNKAAKKQDNSTPKAAVLTLLLFFVALCIFFVSSVIVPKMAILREGGEFGRFMAREEVEQYFTLRLLLTFANIALLSYLLFIYIRDYLRVGASFMLGIIAFLFSFLLYALSSLPLFHIVLGRFDFGGLFSFIPLFFSAVGLLIFAKLGSE